MKIIIGILVTAAALWLTTEVVPGIHIESSLASFLIVAAVFGLVNAFVKPIVKLLSLPVTILTLGLFLLVINALMLMLTAGLVGNAMSIEGEGIAILHDNTTTRIRLTGRAQWTLRAQDANRTVLATDLLSHLA